MRVRNIVFLTFFSVTASFSHSIADAATKQKGKTASHSSPKNKRLDELQKQYIEKLKELHARLSISKEVNYIDNSQAQSLIKSADYLSDLNALRRSSGLPTERGEVRARDNAQHASDKALQSARDVQLIEDDIQKLKIDALKYYGGTLPEWLHTQWSLIESGNGT